LNEARLSSNFIEKNNSYLKRMLIGLLVSTVLFVIAMVIPAENDIFKLIGAAQITLVYFWLVIDGIHRVCKNRTVMREILSSI
jgi:heme/copper-type cytochrome/quinol oxidase subunit 4